MMSIRSIACLLFASAVLPSVLSQTSVVTAGICAKVNLFAQLANGGTVATALTTADAVLGGAICLCLQGTALSPNSAATLNTDLSASASVALQTAVLGVETLLGLNEASLLTALTDHTIATLQGLEGTQGSCTYPANSVPVCAATGSGCTFTCESGYKRCTAPDGTVTCALSCPSGYMSSKRRLLEARTAVCPTGKSACRIVSGFASSVGRDARYECVDAMKDIEQCGGCMLPFQESGKVGVDCTALDPNADAISCRSGFCHIDSCLVGFASNGTACVETGGGGFRLQAALGRR